MKFIIKIEQAGQRLDKFIAGQWPQYSRAYLQKQIKAGAVLVNGKIKKSSYILKENQEIEANILPPAQISLEPDPTIELKILYEDKDIIVIDKPASLTVHPSETQKKGTLVNGLLAHYPPLKDVGDDPARPGIVHRLDKDTSGLMIVAKNNQTFEFLKNQFKNKEVEKKYLVLVLGRPKESSGKIETFLSRSQSDPTKQKIDQTGRKAVTEYKTVKEFQDFTLIEAVPKTGRMHQIRVHLAWLGCPVAGDAKYGKKGRLAFDQLNRQFLHAAYLKIKLPDGQKKEFNSSLPPDLDKALAGLTPTP
jgi:23S rRNA pseudouridine1911/1915/1917 synthase